MLPPMPEQDTNIASLPISNKDDAGITPDDRVLPVDEVEFAKDRQNYENVDRELAQYVSDMRVEITPERTQSYSVRSIGACWLSWSQPTSSKPSTRAL